MRFLLDPPPEDCQTYKTLKYHSYDKDTMGKMRFCLKWWTGRRQKPNGHHYFITIQQRQNFIENLVQREDQKENTKKQQKIDRENQKKQMNETIQVGTILHYSWGYEQTNCEFFQVISKKKSTIQIRPIAQKIVKETAWLAGNVVPIPNQFIGNEIITKRIGPYGIKMDHGTAQPTDPKQSHYFSSYA